jgi:hypothetical protein
MLRYCVEKLVEDSHAGLHLHTNSIPIQYKCKCFYFSDENVIVLTDVEEEEKLLEDKPTMRTRSGKLKSATPRGSTDSLEILPEPTRRRTPRGKDKDKNKDLEAPGQLKWFKLSLSSMEGN